MLRRIIRILWNIMAVIGIVTTVYVVVLTTLVYAHAGRNETTAADAIIVMGTAQYNGRPSPVFRARLDHAVDLYHADVAPILITTGGYGRNDRLSEASVGRAYAIARGIPEHAILSEDYGSSSWESLQNVAILAQHYDVQRVVLVSDPFHMLRLELMAQTLGMEASSSPTRTSPISRRPVAEFFYVLREVGGITTHGLLQVTDSLGRTAAVLQGHLRSVSNIL